MKRTLPSHNKTLTPPECRLRAVPWAVPNSRERIGAREVGDAIKLVRSFGK